MALMVSVSGIRGIFGPDLNPENLARYSAAFGEWTGGKKVVVGRDSRVTGELCEQVVVAALQSAGCDVVKLGIVPTPTVAMAVLKHGAAGGIILSASHNPAEWNALKMLNHKSEFLNAQEGAEVLAIAEKGISYVAWDKIGAVTHDSEALHSHVESILALPYIDAEKIASRNFTVAVDAVNGAGSESIPYLLERLGVNTVHKLHCTPDGLFPHNPEPLPEHLGEICDLIKEKGADLGVVTDPDADRLALVDNNGRLFGEEYTQAAAFDFYLNYKKGDVCTNLSSSMICDFVAEKHGVKCHRAAVGEINVVNKMRETGAVISGEGNGGVILPELHAGRDALVGIAMMLQHLADTGLTAAEYRDSLPDYFISKNKIQLGDINAEAALLKVLHAYAHLDPDDTDGIKILLEDGWAHLRKSNTEPIIRIYTESSSMARANEIADEIKSVIR
ncbi:MAG: phosphoglucosamine mutase [Candidatus Cyclonatronum sp.]|uniref:phosphoglucosamine mutase n=1 Tax=Cyclonatronum sp. TaxID=3024185 RepID=UPI0025C35E3C|nr:phosphoglucosamine mutase [Cyclonatronum sp.]MCH8486281.1 phosphoglucosamine mutase [Cyclonatronum sp.]